MTQTTYEDLGTITPAGALPTVNSTGRVQPLDPRQVTWVGMSQGDVSWRPLRKGVPPTAYTNQVNGIPEFYDIRQAIELWPAPRDSTWLLHMRGYFQPAPFEVDTDVATIDWQAIYLQTVADAKATIKVNGKPLFSQDEINLARAEAKTYVGDLIAGTHGTRRYVPGEPEYLNAPRPLLLDGAGNPLP